MSHKDIAISIRQLSKAYVISHQTNGTGRRRPTFRDVVTDRLRHPLRKTPKETFWALKDVNIEIKKGEVVGIIGRNGAGKSTLLKILSRITKPTDGEIDVYGRVGSLLEVGTGFHSELTGRENIYLNGAILGMRRAEITRQFDAIVDFAGVEQFLDTPVKRYSSGMYVRLAFAVAAHLNPEILIVDEVLAVGDIEFQRKCLGKMKDVAIGGRTVLFVSHNMAAMQTLCQSGVYLKAGRVMQQGTIDQIVSDYLSNDSGWKKAHWQREGLSQNPLSINTVSVELHGEQPRHRLEMSVELLSISAHKPAFVACDVASANGVVVLQALPTSEGFIRSEPRRKQVKLTIELPALIPGGYGVDLWVGSHNTETLDWVKRCVGFEIIDSPISGRSFPHSPEHGHIVPHSTVRYEIENDADAPPEPAFTLLQR
jgi:lipopolysaccharide transport system ATP-binding protein